MGVAPLPKPLLILIPVEKSVIIFHPRCIDILLYLYTCIIMDFAGYRCQILLSLIVYLLIKFCFSIFNNYYYSPYACEAINKELADTFGIRRFLAGASIRANPSISI